VWEQGPSCRRYSEGVVFRKIEFGMVVDSTMPNSIKQETFGKSWNSKDLRAIHCLNPTGPLSDNSVITRISPPGHACTLGKIATCTNMRAGRWRRLKRRRVGGSLCSMAVSI